MNGESKWMIAFFSSLALKDLMLVPFVGATLYICPN